MTGQGWSYELVRPDVFTVLWCGDVYGEVGWIAGDMLSARMAAAVDGLNGVRIPLPGPWSMEISQVDPHRIDFLEHGLPAGEIRWGRMIGPDTAAANTGRMVAGINNLRLLIALEDADRAARAATQAAG